MLVLAVKGATEEKGLHPIRREEGWYRNRNEVFLKYHRNFSRRLIRESRQHRDAQSTTLMLIVVIAVFLTTEIPIQGLETLVGPYRGQFQFQLHGL